MKNHPGIFMLVLMACSMQLHAQHWTTTTVFHQRDVNTLKYLNKQTLIAAGGSEINDSLQNFLRSPDYGLSWEDHGQICACVTIKSLDFSDTLHGFAVGIGGNMKKTIDGGLSWTFVASPIYRNWHKVVYTDAQRLYAVGGWQKDSLRQTVITSNDSGYTWSVLYDQVGPSLRDVYFFSQQKAVAVGDSGTILITFNAGLNWTPVTAPIIRHFNAIDFSTSDTGYIVGGRRYNDSLRTMLKTTNGGLNWITIKDEPGGWLTDITFPDANNGKITGDRATLWNTSDGGKTWTPEIIPGSKPDQYFACIHMLNKNYGAVGAHFGTIFLYNDLPLPVATTIPATSVDSSHATMQSLVNMQGIPGQVIFHFDTDSTFSNDFTSFPEHIASDTPARIAFRPGGLNRSTKYYYYVEALTVAGRDSGSVLSFTTTPNFLVITQPATLVTSNSAQLNAVVQSEFSLPASVFFEYGTDTNVTSQVAASIPVLNNTQQYAVTATLSLTANTHYYYRIKLVVNGATYYGAMLSFFTGTIPFTELSTLPAVNINDTSATLRGVVDGIRMPTLLYFEYGLTPDMTDSAVLYTGLVNDTLRFDLQHYLAGLQPNRVYYFRLSAKNALGIFNADILTFYTGTGGFAVKTDGASQVTTTSAQLNGRVRHMQGTTQLSFEYGLTETMGSVVTGTPAQISDSLLYSTSATLAGLQPNTLYYYRLKAETTTATIYGEPGQFHTGTVVPNWDFEYWRHDTFALLDYWNLIGDDYERVPGRTGNYAVKLTHTTAAFIGGLADNTGNNTSGQSSFVGGVPFNARPDSVVFWLNYKLAPGDVSAVAIHLYNAAREDIATNFHILDSSGNTNGVFKRFVYPITYNNSKMPDTIVIGALNGIPDFPSSDSTNFLIIDDVSTVPSTPIANSGFESWFDYPHYSLLQWSYYKHLLIDRNNMGGEKFIRQVQGVNGAGDTAVEVVNETFGNLYFGSELASRRPGFGFKNENGFPVSTRYKALNGMVKWFPVNGDSALIDVQLINGSQMIAYGQLYLPPDTIAQFTPFEVPMLYNTSTLIPDNALILLRSYVQPTAKGPSRLVVDKLSFDGHFIGPDTASAIHEFGDAENGIRLYPNPAENVVTIESQVVLGEWCNLQLFDINGRLAKEVKIANPVNKISFSTSDMNPGFYLLSITTGSKSYTAKLVLAK